MVFWTTAPVTINPIRIVWGFCFSFTGWYANTMFDFLLGGSSGKKLTLKKLDKELREIAALSPEEREYVKAALSRYLSGGISKMEAEHAVRQLKLNFKDNLDAIEAEKVRQKILGYFA